jgi:prolipoprotein diacylglyceryltransferase
MASELGLCRSARLAVHGLDRTIGLYQPTFLYESLWDLAVAALLVWAGRRFVRRRGRLFALHVAAYTVGGGWIEALRVDHANHFLGLRLTDWTSLLVFLGAVDRRGSPAPRIAVRLTRCVGVPRPDESR